MTIILLFGAFISLKVLVSNPTEKNNIKKKCSSPPRKKERQKKRQVSLKFVAGFNLTGNRLHAIKNRLKFL